MRHKLINLGALAAVLLLTVLYSTEAFSQGCVVTGATPGGGEIVVCSGTDTDGLVTTDNADDVTIEEDSDISAGGFEVIQTQAGNDKVLMEGGIISGNTPNTDCIELGTGDSEFHMTGGKLLCEHGVRCDNPCTAKITIDDGMILDSEECIDTADGNDEIFINGGMFTATSAVLDADDGDDLIIITGGTFIQLTDEDQAIDTGNDNDTISVSHATIDGRTADQREAVNGDSGNDTVKLGSGAVILGISSGGEDFDTLVFEMEVQEQLIDGICANILAQSPAEGQITINGLLYEWNQFEVLECNLRPFESMPIPTLSQWGLIAMAGVIGIAGILFYRKRAIRL